VQRIRDGADRPLATVPRDGALIAAGSFGLAVALTGRRPAPVYRIGWLSVDAVLPAR